MKLYTKIILYFKFQIAKANLSRLKYYMNIISYVQQNSAVFTRLRVIYSFIMM